MEKIINGLKQIKTRVDSGTITTVNGTETLLSKQLEKMIEVAINYTRCCTELKTFDIHECINEVTKSANKLSPWIVDARKDRSFRYRIKKAIDKMLYSN